MKDETEAELVEDDQAISVLDQAPGAIRKYGRPVKDVDVAAWAEKKEGPFSTELRLHCPLHGFSLMPAVICIGCIWFGGVRERVIHAGANQSMDLNEPLVAAKAFMVVCGHPTTRGLTYVPNVPV